jgi:Fic family protein
MQNWDGTSEGNKIAKALAAQTDWWTFTDSGTIGCDLSKNKNINDDFAGRFRKPSEYVQVGTYIAPAPEKVEPMIESIAVDYNADSETYFVDRIAKFHLAFESTHPFCDGNGRMGRVIINYQLSRFGFPSIIIRNKEKRDYYEAFGEYHGSKKTKPMESVISLALIESLHKRLAYLRSDTIIPLAEYAKKQKKSTNTLLNAARRQTIPAFREKGVWKIGGLRRSG